MILYDIIIIVLFYIFFNQGCRVKLMQYGDEIDNDCDGEIDEERVDGKGIKDFGFIIIYFLIIFCRIQIVLCIII